MDKIKASIKHIIKDHKVVSGCVIVIIVVLAII